MTRFSSFFSSSKKKEDRPESSKSDPSEAPGFKNANDSGRTIGSSLNSRLQEAIRHLQTVIRNLDSALLKFKERDSTLFNAMVSSIQDRDNARATILANEIAEVRKYTKMIMGSRLSLEQMVLRLNTLGDLGDVVSTLTPTVSLVSSLRQGLLGVMPEAQERIGEVSELLSEIITEASPSSGADVMSAPRIGAGMVGSSLDEEVEVLLSEAAALAESKTPQELPETPAERASDGESEMDMEPA